MKTPVIIAAHNEAAMIGRTLNNLDARFVEPHVIANGCEDITAEIAQSFGGVVVYENKESGKLPAIQTVLRALGDRALEPILYTDADSYPLSTRGWHKYMLGALDQDAPSAATGPIVLDTIGVSELVYDAKYCLDTLVARRRQTTRFRGANMATWMQKESVLKRILDLPHIWPGEDLAVEIEILSEGGTSRQVVRPAASVVTSSRYVSHVANFAKEGRQGVRKKALTHYKERAADGSIPLSRHLKNQRT